MQFLLLLINLTQLIIEIYREVKTFKREMRIIVNRENRQRQQLYEVQRFNNNNYDNED